MVLPGGMNYGAWMNLDEHFIYKYIYTLVHSLCIQYMWVKTYRVCIYIYVYMRVCIYVINPVD